VSGLLIATVRMRRRSGSGSQECCEGADIGDVADEPGSAGAGVEGVGDVDDPCWDSRREAGGNQFREAGPHPVELLLCDAQRLGVPALVRGAHPDGPQPVVEQRSTRGPDGCCRCPYPGEQPVEAFGAEGVRDGAQGQEVERAGAGFVELVEAGDTVDHGTGGGAGGFDLDGHGVGDEVVASP